MLFANRECIPNSGKLVRLWMHEANRVYSDKLVDHKDKETLAKLISENIKKYFPVCQFVTSRIIQIYFQGLVTRLVSWCRKFQKQSTTKNPWYIVISLTVLVICDTCPLCPGLNCTSLYQKLWVITTSWSDFWIWYFSKMPWRIYAGRV